MGLQNGVSARNAGYQNVQYLRETVTFADNGIVKTIGKAPSGSLVLKPISGMQVTAVFNAGTTNAVDIGTTADDDLFGTDLAAGTLAFVPLDEAIGGFLLTADATFTATVALTGTAATTGSAEIVITFIPPN
jgi:hypothetical protein